MIPSNTTMHAMRIRITSQISRHMPCKHFDTIVSWACNALRSALIIRRTANWAISSHLFLVFNISIFSLQFFRINSERVILNTNSQYLQRDIGCCKNKLKSKMYSGLNIRKQLPTCNKSKVSTKLLPKALLRCTHLVRAILCVFGFQTMTRHLQFLAAAVVVLQTRRGPNLTNILPHLVRRRHLLRRIREQLLNEHLSL